MNSTSEDIIILCTTEDRLSWLVTSILAPKDFKLISALNQRMVFSLIELYSPLAVIADSGLSGVMGYKPWEIIKGIDRFRDTKVLLITATSSPHDKDAIKHVDEVIDIDAVSSDLLPAVSKFSPCGTQLQVNEDARRLARAIVSDIVYYNRDAAFRGAAEGTFYDILRPEIEKGMAVYQQRISAGTTPLPDYFNDAIRDFINKTQQCNLVLP